MDCIVADILDLHSRTGLPCHHVHRFLTFSCDCATAATALPDWAVTVSSRATGAKFVVGRVAGAGGRYHVRGWAKLD
jgi:hypothetical protein